MYLSFSDDTCVAPLAFENLITSFSRRERSRAFVGFHSLFVRLCAIALCGSLEDAVEHSLRNQRRAKSFAAPRARAAVRCVDNVVHGTFCGFVNVLQKAPPDCWKIHALYAPKYLDRACFDLSCMPNYFRYNLTDTSDFTAQNPAQRVSISR